MLFKASVIFFVDFRFFGCPTNNTFLEKAAAHLYKNNTTTYDYSMQYLSHQVSNTYTEAETLKVLIIIEFKFWTSFSTASFIKPYRNPVY